MRESRKSFDQVKGILAKLDSSIETAREKRLSGSQAGEPVIGRSSEGGSGELGRARPMRRESVFKSPAEWGVRERPDGWRGREG